MAKMKKKMRKEGAEDRRESCLRERNKPKRTEGQRSSEDLRTRLVKFKALATLLYSWAKHYPHFCSQIFNYS